MKNNQFFCSLTLTAVDKILTEKTNFLANVKVMGFRICGKKLPLTIFRDICIIQQIASLIKLMAVLKNKSCKNSNFCRTAPLNGSKWNVISWMHYKWARENVTFHELTLDTKHACCNKFLVYRILLTFRTTVHHHLSR